MFTGLVKGLGVVKNIAPFGGGRRLRIDMGPLIAGIELGQSVAVNGACLTVTAIAGGEAAFDAVSETVERTAIGNLRAGDRVNLEPALKVGDALDGHIMLGHVDAVGIVLSVEAVEADNRVIRIGLPREIQCLVAEKGSVAVDGISLTVSGAGDDWFSVAVIPHTWKNSTLSLRAAGDAVNLEADVLARYAARILQYGFPKSGGIDEEFLRRNGFA